MNITLPPYATTEDLQKCMVIVREILDSKAITINDEQCQAIGLLINCGLKNDIYFLYW